MNCNDELLNLLNCAMDSKDVARIFGWIDEQIAIQLDEILHHESFQQLEAIWRGTEILTGAGVQNNNVKVELLQCTLSELAEDLRESPSLIHLPLYQHIYEDEFDMPGGEPYAALVGAWAFSGFSFELDVLKMLANVASVAHCPFIGGVHAAFFGKKSMTDVISVEDIQHTFARAEYSTWRSFRTLEVAKYICLVLPRILLRNPWDIRGKSGVFQYVERIFPNSDRAFLWGNSAFAMAANLVQNFIATGWCMNIIDQPVSLPRFTCGQRGLAWVDGFVPCSRAQEFSAQGFNAFCLNEKDRFMYFPCQSSLHASDASLPYVFLASRMVHYLKVLQRDGLGLVHNERVLQKELNEWLQGLVTRMEHPEPSLAAHHPFRYAQAIVSADENSAEHVCIEVRLEPHGWVENFAPCVARFGGIPCSRKEE